MTEHAISARIEGERVAIETIVDDPDYKGVLNTTYLDAEAAIRFGKGVIRRGRVALRRKLLGGSATEGMDVSPASAPSIEGKHLPLAVPTDPHTEDGR